jgi:hypothetical protein
MTPDQRKLLRALSTRGEYAKTYNPAAQYMPRPENTLLARMARHGLPEDAPGTTTTGGAPQTGPQRPGAWGLLGPVVAPNLSAKLGAKGG